MNTISTATVRLLTRRINLSTKSLAIMAWTSIVMMLFLLASCDGHHCHYNYRPDGAVAATPELCTTPSVQYNPEFGYQPTSPTPGATIIPWATVYGPRSPMAVDYNGGQTTIQMVPKGMTVYFDRQNRWTWTVDGKRVKFSTQRIPELQQQVHERWPTRQLHVQPYPPIMRKYPR